MTEIYTGGIMKHCALILGIIVMCAVSADAAWTGYNEGSKAARTSGKLMIVDFSTDWCGWCKKMDKEVFSDKVISARLARDFITVRLDAESAAPLIHKGKKMETRQFTAYSGVQGFPTLIVYDSKENVVSVLPGYVDAKTFGVYLDYLQKGEYRKMTFEDYIGRLNRK